MELMRFVLGFFDYLYVFYWRQSLVGFLLLIVVTGLILLVLFVPHVFLRKWIRRVCTDKVRSLRPHLAFRDVLRYLYYWLLKTWCNPLSSILTCLILLTGWNLLFREFGEKVFVRPSSSKYSILVTKFSGVETQDRFGELGTRDLIARELHLSADSVTAELTEVSFSNSICANGLEAKQLRRDRGFDMLIWGFVESGTESLTVTVRFCLDMRLSVIPVHRPYDTSYFDLVGDMSFTMPVTHPMRMTKLHNWLRKKSLSGLMVTAIGKKLWVSAILYLDRMTIEFPDSEGDDALAYSAIKSICLYEICKFDVTRWDELLESAVKCDSISATYENFPQSLLTVIKWYAGKALVGLGDSSGAELYFRQAIDVDSGHISAFVDLSKLLFELKRYDDAIEIVAHGLEFRPDNIPLLKLAAFECLSLKMWTELLYYLEALNEVHPGDETTMFYLCNSYVALGDYEKCLEHLSAWQEMMGELTERLVYASIHTNLAMSKVSFADSLYRANLTEWPCLRLLAIDFAQAYIRTGEMAKARHALSKFDSITRVEAGRCASRLGIEISRYEDLPALLRRQMQD